jgi:hypothetical protein
MISRKLAGSLIAATALLGLGVTTSVVADAAGIESGSTTEATPSGSAVTKDVCAWYVGGVSSTLTLAPADGATYDGSALILSSDNAPSKPGDLTAYANAATDAGSATAHTDCSWFADAQRQGITLNMGVTSNAFTAAYGATPTADSGMGFSLSTGNKLNANFTKGTCKIDGATDSVKWTATTFAVAGTASVSSDVMKLAASDVTTKPDPTKGGDVCSQSQVWDVTIPASLHPASPKATYTFTGPKITTTITLS